MPRLSLALLIGLAILLAGGCTQIAPRPAEKEDVGARVRLLMTLLETGNPDTQSRAAMELGELGSAA